MVQIVDFDIIFPKVQKILDDTLPKGFFSRIAYNKFLGIQFLGITMAASDYKINRIDDQFPQEVYLSLNQYLELSSHYSVIFRQPNKDLPSERFLAMQSIKIPFRTPLKKEENVLKAIKKFVVSYVETLKANKDVLMYKEYVDYDKLLN